MLHTKFLGNRPAGSGVDFKGFLPNVGMAAILVKGPASCQIFVSLYPKAFIKIWFRLAK